MKRQSTKTSYSIKDYKKYLKIKKEPRYGNKTRKECLGGCKNGAPRSHDSVEEANYCDKLRLLKIAGDFRDYRSQKTFPLYDPVTAERVGGHRVDFYIEENDGSFRIDEYKGSLFATLPEYKVKRALFRYCYPDLPYNTVMKEDIRY